MKKLSIMILPMVLVACSGETMPSPATQNPTQSRTANVNVGEPQAEQLLNKAPAMVQGFLGQPSLVRHDGNVQVFQFKNQTCVLDVYFYREGAGEGFLANHVDVRTNNGGELEPNTCLKGFFVEGNYPEELLEQAVITE